MALLIPLENTACKFKNDMAEIYKEKFTKKGTKCQKHGPKIKRFQCYAFVLIGVANYAIVQIHTILGS